MASVDWLDDVEAEISEPVYRSAAWRKEGKASTALESRLCCVALCRWDLWSLQKSKQRMRSLFLFFLVVFSFSYAFAEHIFPVHIGNQSINLPSFSFDSFIPSSLFPFLKSQPIVIRAWKNSVIIALFKFLNFQFVFIVM